MHRHISSLQLRFSRKNTKRDASLFYTFKYGKFCDNWRRSTTFTSNTQDTEDVLDSYYSVTSPEEIALFHEKQKLIHSFFDKLLHIDAGKKYFRKHEHDFDAQEMYKKLGSH